MQKPKKRLVLRGKTKHATSANRAIGYNEACDNWDKWYKEVYDIPLQRLTPQGSEFVNNPERCFSYIKDLLNSGFEARKEVIRLKRQLKKLKMED